MAITDKIAKLCSIENEKELDKEIGKLTDNEKKIIISATIKFIKDPTQNIRQDN